MKFHDELNQKIFSGEELKPEVKDKLKEIADAFIDFLEVPADAIKDVVITGSSVSYNYTKFSDIDLHLKVDFDKIHEDCPIVQGYLWQSKAMFNKNHDISIYGIPVEVYAESIDEDSVHNGLYSLWQDKWIDFPQKIKPTDNDAAVEAKFNEFKDMADNINDSEEAEEILNKLYEMRKAGLEDAGEFSTENLAFKKVRDAGILDKLKAMKKARIDKQLSLESYNENFNYDDLYGNIIPQLAKERAHKEFLNKMNPQELVNYAVRAIKQNDADITDVENTLYNSNYTPGQVEDIMDMIRIALDESINEEIATKTQNGVTWTGFEKDDNGKIWTKTDIVNGIKYVYVIYQPHEFERQHVMITEITKDNYKELEKYYSDIPVGKIYKHPVYEFDLGERYYMDSLQDAIDFLYKHFEEKINKNESVRESISAEDYIKNLGLDAKKKGVDYTLKGYKNGKVEYSVCYANLKKAAQCFLDNCGKYDKLVFSEIGQGYDCVIDTDSKELNTMPKYLKDAFVNEEVEETKNYKRTRLCSPKSCKPDSFRTKTVNKDGDKIVLCKDKETGKMKAQSKLEKKNESVDKNIYKPSLILKAYSIEHAWYKEAGKGEDEKLPEIMLFIIEDGEIKGTKKVKREDVYTYKGAENEYYLRRVRDTEDIITDYNLEHVQHLVDDWNAGKRYLAMSKNEDIATLTDKIDAADSDLKDLIDKLQPKKVDEDIDTLCDKVDSATSELQSIIKSFSAERNDIVESLESIINEALGD